MSPWPVSPARGRPFPTQLPDFLARVRASTEVPLAVGFGVSTPEHAAEVAKYADGVIIGSRLINHGERGPIIDVAGKSVVTFLNEVNEVLD